MSAAEYLDQLDQLRAAATAGEWATYWGDHIGTGVEVTSPGGVRVQREVVSFDDWRGDADNAEGENPASVRDDAALIVAAVNALPQLATALREVLKLADSWRREGERLGDDGSIHDRHGKAIQFAIGDALSPAAAEAEQ